MKKVLYVLFFGLVISINSMDRLPEPIKEDRGVTMTFLKESKQPVSFLMMKKETEQSRKIVSDLTENNAKVLAVYDKFANHIVEAYQHSKISETELQKIFKAINFAARKHGTEGKLEKKQTRNDKDKTHYIIHPLGVANDVVEIGREFTADIIIGALLHDTVEDTNTTFAEIREQFGIPIESYVREVTDDTSLTKEQRKEQQIKTAHKKSLGAAIIKYCDQIYNLTDLKHNPPTDWSQERIKQYFEWTQKVVNQLPAANKHLQREVNRLLGDLLINKA